MISCYHRASEGGPTAPKYARRLINSLLWSNMLRFGGCPVLQQSYNFLNCFMP